MKTWKNESFEKRGDHTSIVFAQSESVPHVSGKWVEVDEFELDFSNCTQLWIECNVRLFGYL